MFLISFFININTIYQRLYQLRPPHHLLNATNTTIPEKNSQEISRATTTIKDLPLNPLNLTYQKKSDETYP